MSSKPSQNKLLENVGTFYNRDHAKYLQRNRNMSHTLKGLEENAQIPHATNRSLITEGFNLSDKMNNPTLPTPDSITAVTSAPIVFGADNFLSFSVPQPISPFLGLHPSPATKSKSKFAE